MRETVGKKIQRMRIEKGFSREELAEKLNISRSALERMENGRSNSWANHLKNLSRVFDVPPEEFLKKEKHESTNENQSSGLSLQNNDKIKTIFHLNEKMIAVLEARLRGKDELITMLKNKHKRNFLGIITITNFNLHLSIFETFI